MCLAIIFMEIWKRLRKSQSPEYRQWLPWEWGLLVWWRCPIRVVLSPEKRSQGPTGARPWAAYWPLLKAVSNQYQTLICWWYGLRALKQIQILSNSHSFDVIKNEILPAVSWSSSLAGGAAPGYIGWLWFQWLVSVCTSSLALAIAIRNNKTHNTNLIIFL